MAERAGKYLYFIVDEINRRGLPTELALLPFVESAYNPTALSRAQASGCGSSCRPRASTST